MPTSSREKLRIHINVDITAGALQAIVAHAKQVARKNENGTLCIDTADKVSEMISRFLEDNDFETYVKNIANG